MYCIDNKFSGCLLSICPHKSVWHAHNSPSFCSSRSLQWVQPAIFDCWSAHKTISCHCPNGIRCRMWFSTQHNTLKFQLRHDQFHTSGHCRFLQKKSWGYVLGWFESLLLSNSNKYSLDCADTVEIFFPPKRNFLFPMCCMPLNHFWKFLFFVPVLSILKNDSSEPKCLLIMAMQHLEPICESLCCPRWPVPWYLTWVPSRLL